MSNLAWALLLTSTVAEAPAAPTFRLHAANAAPVVGTLAGLDADWSVTLAGETTVRVAGSEVVSLRRVGVRLPADPVGPHAVLTNGDRWPGVLVGVAEDQAQFRAGLDDALGGEADRELRLPVTGLAVVWMQGPSLVPALDPAGFGTSRRRDVVSLRNGDTLQGSLSSLAAGRLRLQPTGGGAATEVNVGQVAALALNTDLARRPRPKGVFARAVLRNGTRLTLSSARLEKQELVGKSVFGPEVRLPLTQLVTLDLFQGAAVYLSDLKPKRYRFEPYQGEYLKAARAIDYGTDGVGDGHKLRLGRNTFDKGLCLHSHGRLTYALTSDYRWFEATVGLDDRLGKLGKARVRVLVDGKAYAVGPADGLTAADGPQAVRVPLDKVRELTLEVNFGRNGGVWHDSQNFVAWAEARLIK